MGYAPLGTVVAGFFADHPTGRFPYPEGIYRTVEPVVHTPVHKGLLVFHIPRPPVFIGKELLLIGNPVSIRVGILVHIVGIRFHGKDAVFSIWQYKAREDQLVYEGCTAFVDPVVILVLPARNTAYGFEGAV